MSINLHSIVRSTISNIHADETVTLYQSVGVTVDRGRRIPEYLDPLTVQAQVQTLSSQDILHMEQTTRGKVAYKMYLYAPTSSGLVPKGIERPLSRNGDMIRRADGTWWLVTGLIEDFSKSGWCLVSVVQQLEPPAGIGA